MLWWWTGSAQLDACIALCLAAPARTPHGPKGGPATLIAHVDSHLAGTLRGQVPQQWLTDNNRQRCMVCGLSVSVRSGVHPTARAAFSGSDAGRAAAALTLPSLDELQSAQGRALRHIPAAARFLWGQALGRAFAAAAHHNDLRTWTELLMLPQCVLSAPPRAGRRHRRSSCLLGPVAPLGRGGTPQSLGRCRPATWWAQAAFECRQETRVGHRPGQRRL